jgi:hypothetical protein
MRPKILPLRFGRLNMPSKTLNIVYYITTVVNTLAVYLGYDDLDSVAPIESLKRCTEMR